MFSLEQDFENSWHIDPDNLKFLTKSKKFKSRKPDLEKKKLFLFDECDL